MCVECFIPDRFCREALREFASLSNKWQEQRATRRSLGMKPGNECQCCSARDATRCSGTLVTYHSVLGTLSCRAMPRRALLGAA